MLAAHKNPWFRVITDICNSAESAAYTQPPEYLAFCLPLPVRPKYRLYFHTARLTEDPALLDSILSWIFTVTTTGFAAKLGTAASGVSVQLLESRWRSWLLEAYVVEGRFEPRSADQSLYGVNLRVPLSRALLEKRSGRPFQETSLFEPGGPIVLRSDWGGAGIVCVDRHLVIMGNTAAVGTGERQVKLGWLEVGRRPTPRDRDEISLIEVEIRKGERIPLGMAFLAPKAEGNFSLRMISLPPEDCLQLELDFTGLPRASVQSYERRLRPFRQDGAHMSIRQQRVLLKWKLDRKTLVQM